MISLEVALDFWLSERSAENRERLVEHYSYLCTRGARKFLRPGLERGDLEQVAAIGLLKACDRFEAAMQTPFEAYAWLFIVGELMHHVRDHERVVRPPRKLRDLERRYQRTVDKLTFELGRVPSDADVAAVLGTTLDMVSEVRQCRARATAESLEDLQGRTIEPSGYEEVERLLDAMVIESALSALNETEREIITAVYAHGQSQVEIAARLGYSQRHISRLHRGALEKMLPSWVH